MQCMKFKTQWCNTQPKNWTKTSLILKNPKVYQKSQKLGQKTSGTIAIHTAFPATQYVGMLLNSVSYGCHTTYSSQKTSRQHIRQLSIFSSNRQLQCVYFKVHQSYILFLNMSKTHFGTWSSIIEAICSRFRSKKTLEGLFFLLGTHNYLQSRTRGSISTTFLQTYSFD